MDEVTLTLSLAEARDVYECLGIPGAHKAIRTDQCALMAKVLRVLVPPTCTADEATCSETPDP